MGYQTADNMTHDPDVFEQAEQRADQRLLHTPLALSARYDGRVRRVVVLLNNGIELGFRPQAIEGLEKARAADLHTIEVSPSGLGLHFPALDADVYLPGLMQGWMGSRHWMAQQMGQAGGKAKTEAKASAARRNGQRGGRPRKVDAATESA